MAHTRISNVRLKSWTLPCFSIQKKLWFQSTHTSDFSTVANTPHNVKIQATCPCTRPSPYGASKNMLATGTVQAAKHKPLAASRPTPIGSLVVQHVHECNTTAASMRGAGGHLWFYLFGVPILRIIVFWGPYWSFPI